MNHGLGPRGIKTAALLAVLAFGSACGGQSQQSSAAETTPAPGAAQIATFAPRPTDENQSQSQDDSGDPPAVSGAKQNPECSEQDITDVSDDDRVLVLDDGTRYLIPDEYQAITSTWEGDTVYYCDGGPGHRYFVNEDGDSVPVGALDE